MGQKVHPLGFRSGNRLKTPNYALNAWDGVNSRDFLPYNDDKGRKTLVLQGFLFSELEDILDRAGFLVNRLEINFPGKNAVLVCEVLTKSSTLGKGSKKDTFKKVASLDLLSSENISAKLKPFLGGRTLILRLSVLDGLLQHPTMFSLEKDINESLKGKKLGTGLIFLALDLIRSVCLAMQLPVAGLLSSAFIKLAQKSPNHRLVFDYLNQAFTTAYTNSKPFRRLRGVGMQVKGR
jgi:hypothetical protein